MSTLNPLATFRVAARLYLLANAFDLYALRDRFAEPTHAAQAVAFRQGLGLERADPDRANFEALTALDFDSDAEFQAFLTAVEAFLFEDGPHP
ncbi:MAG: hypothetical protein R3F62_05950 [Planctomycetota bacterium]